MSSLNDRESGRDDEHDNDREEGEDTDDRGNSRDEETSRAVTWFLSEARNDPSLESVLWELIYPAVHREANKIIFKRNRNDRATSLVHEFYMRWDHNKDLIFKSRRSFYKFVSEVMKCIVIDRVRKEGSLKRGGKDAIHSVYDDQLIGKYLDMNNMILLDKALEALKQKHPRTAEIMNYYLIGMKVAEIMEITKLSESTVKRELHFGRAWLKDYTK